MFNFPFQPEPVPPSARVTREEIFKAFNTDEEYFNQEFFPVKDLSAIQILENMTEVEFYGLKQVQDQIFVYMMTPMQYVQASRFKV